MKKSFFFLLACLIGFAWTGCKDDEGTPTPDGPTITLFKIEAPFTGVGAIDETARTISVDYPFGADVSAVNVAVTTSPATATVTPANPVDFSTGDVTFTVTDAGISTSYIVSLVEGPNPLRLVLVGEAATVDGNNNEIANAYNWALDKYKEKAQYIPFTDLTAEDIETAVAMWFHLEAPGGRELPAEATGDALNVIKDFYSKGGNLLLTKHATQYLVNVGRITSDWGPTDGGDGTDPFDNPDDWGQAFEFADKFADGNADSPIFTGLTPKEVSFDGFTYNAYMYIDGGSKRDNSFFWFSYNIPGMKAEFDTDGDGVISEAERDTNGDGIFENGVDDDTIFRKFFEQENNAVIRGTFEWDPVFAGAEFFTTVEFNPDSNFDGKAIALGAGCYEWYQDDGRTNAWRGNIETLHSNIFEYFGVE